MVEEGKVDADILATGADSAPLVILVNDHGQAGPWL